MLPVSDMGIDLKGDVLAMATLKLFITIIQIQESYIYDKNIPKKYLPKMKIKAIKVHYLLKLFIFPAFVIVCDIPSLHEFQTQHSENCSCIFFAL